jgi:exopolysaccharide production protein ExoZ
MPRQILYNVQALRFLAASAIVLSHAADLLIPHNRENAWIWSVPWYAGVDVFFVISGFIMAIVAGDAFGVPGAATHFLKRRIIRIVPPYWFFTSATVVAVLALGGRIGGTTVTLPQLITSYGFIPWPRADGKLNPILSQGWTLNYEAFFYAAFAIALLARRGKLALCIAFAGLAAIHAFVPSEWFALKFWSNPIFLEFVAGIGLAKLYRSGFKLPRAGSAACVAAAILAFLVSRNPGFDPFDRFIHIGIPAILLCASLMLAPEPRQIGPVRGWVLRGGDASYTIYLAHYMIVHAVLILWTKGGIPLPWFGVAFAFICSVLLSIIFFQLVERPVTDRLQRLFGQRRSNDLEMVAP